MHTTTSNAGTVNISGNTMSGSGITYAAGMNIFAADYSAIVVTTLTKQ
jgi:hypothetical protein